jgi:hypothetical protein
VLLAVVGVMFRQHQSHLEHLVSIRDEVASLVPDGSYVIANNGVRKLFGVPRSGVPSYRMELFDFLGMPVDHAAEIATEHHTWYFAVVPKGADDALARMVDDFVGTHRMTRVPTRNADLILYSVDAGDTPTADPAASQGSR